MEADSSSIGDLLDVMLGRMRLDRTAAPVCVFETIRGLPVSQRTFRMRRFPEAGALLDEATDLLGATLETLPDFAEASALAGSQHNHGDWHAAYHCYCKAAGLAALNDDELVGSLACYEAAELLMMGALGPMFAKADADRLLQQARKYEVDLARSGIRQAREAEGQRWTTAAAVHAVYNKFVAGLPADTRCAARINCNQGHQVLAWVVCKLAC
ncbi:hypothetical protein WJX72_010465 [[Myrmecia] bisecta]|uniref:Uncharacterized protein n=1 Tax=[Myrmecia] bisecta TaxID=41462 RepID=A0AAW1RAC2_9CHLO